MSARPVISGIVRRLPGPLRDLAYRSVTRARGYLERRRTEKARRRDFSLAIRRNENILRMHKEAATLPVTASGGPIVIFNSSAHKETHSFFSLVQLLVAWDLRREGERVLNVICRGGLSRCNVPMGQPSFGGPPPCNECGKMSDVLFDPDLTEAYGPEHRNPTLRAKLAELSQDQLAAYVHEGLDIGGIAVPSVRWAIRLHNLPRDQATRDLLEHHVASGVELFDYFRGYLERVKPKVVVAFNGTLLPEAIVREVCARSQVRFVSFEVGFNAKSSVFFARGRATDVPMRIPADYELTAAELARLEEYLRKRWGGKFHVGGRRFWDKMVGISPALKQKIEQYDSLVTIFTNVVFDTSQVSVNTIFSDMFEWLETTAAVALEFPKTLFVIRAHPEEARKSRPSRETVAGWFERSRVRSAPNMVLIPSTEQVSSYELMDASKFCTVYNSTVGVEAAIRGTPVLSGASSKYSREGFTYMPADRADYLATLRRFLETREVPFEDGWSERAKRYLYFLVFRHSLRMTEVIGVGPPEALGYFFRFSGLAEIRRAHPEETAIIRAGILGETDQFCYPDPERVPVRS